MPEGGTGAGGTIEPPHASAQVDLLFVVDNSMGMADKQAILADSAPTLIHRFLHPRCIDADGVVNGYEVNAVGECLAGAPEFPAVTDLHVGVITSSLGSHGSNGACTDPSGDDHGQLLGALRPDPEFPYVTWDDSGFLSWNEDPSLGSSDESDFNESARNMILSAGQTGCGFEAPLEAMYRFLIDPQPPTSIPVVTDVTAATMPVFSADPANPVLRQRSQFLRPDSNLAIVLISDENDCSILDSGQGWLVGTSQLAGSSFRMPRATSVCAANPNDPCCVSCASVTPDGCPDSQADPACQQGAYTAADDNLNLRCFDQKARFGFDLLYPISRYVDGLTKPTVVDRVGKTVPNPLFPPGGRTPSMVFLTGILGVPWQDLAATATLEQDAPLEYLSPAELETEGRWDLVLGTPGDATTPPVSPADKLMFETPADRTQLFGKVRHPLLGAAAALAPSTTKSGRPNPINGHESINVDNTTLQYACISPLPEARPTCDGYGCECVTTDGLGNQTANQYNRPICDGTTQTHVKANPSLRQLRFIKEVAAQTVNASPASVCWKDLTSTPGARVTDYGYDPAMHLLVNTMVTQLNR